ncbi:MAG: hypothetical protein KBG83_00035 [Bacteroidetes bacterium]|nr:hypothetical protein [Bacteroidota bacterium]
MESKEREVATVQERLRKQNEEIENLQNVIKAYEHKIHELKPLVVEYNELLRNRKELRRELAVRQKQMKIVKEFLEGTTLFDLRFPLFNQLQQEEV